MRLPNIDISSVYSQPSNCQELKKPVEKKKKQDSDDRVKLAISGYRTPDEHRRLHRTITVRPDRKIQTI
jgi:hypothetical protein